MIRFSRLTRPFRVAALIALGVVGGVAVVALAADSGSKPAPTAVRSLGASRVVDLSHVIDQKIPLWPGDPKVRFKVVASFAKDGYYLRKFAIGEHSATHMNAPNSFHGGGAGIASYRAAQLIKPVVVIDIRRKAKRDRDYALTRADLADWETSHGRVPAGSVVLLDTGWSRYWKHSKKFFGLDRQGGLHFPGFAGSTTRFMLAHRRIAGVGIDTHGVDPGQDELYQTNTAVLRKKRIVLENLTNLDRLPATGTTIVIGSLKLRGGSGSPVAVTALVR